MGFADNSILCLSKLADGRVENAYVLRNAFFLGVGRSRGAAPVVRRGCIDFFHQRSIGLQSRTMAVRPKKTAIQNKHNFVGLTENKSPVETGLALFAGEHRNVFAGS